ncbi:hypothetical protein M426DRAFT_62001 [Hypoxylon sp. CI-4A]|nr:hypothetical protein M426DRAFT_62001 [Hypoxylon sp. CI-4A]
MPELSENIALQVVGGGVLKRRKVRKGTQSCWECKRRKTRCTFAAPTDSICDGCRSRQTRCISQVFHDEVPYTSKNNDRLDRMESLVEQVTRMLNQLNISQQHKSPEPPISAIASGPSLESLVSSDFGSLSDALLAVWPNRHDLDLIVNVPIGISILFHGVVCQSYTEMFSRQIESPQRMLQTPSRDSHPVFIARRILLLATLLQGIPPNSVDKLVGLSSDYRIMMSRLFSTVTKLVTSNDELVNSIEGIECIMMESMYLNNAGNLRQAWLANRRAMSMAQLMGLHTGASSSSMFLEAETQNRINPSYMWFRLVVSDRYLSLMLGLPQGSHEHAFANLEPEDKCMAIERMERLESVAGSLIIQRNSADRTNLAATSKIDKLLQDAATAMPPQWWSTTFNPTTISGNGIKAFEETLRLMNQFTHNHLLVQLHLPYMMLSSSTELSYDYNKMIAANASRTILTQFISFRNSILASAYCRGIDFITFIASTTLCLAHIESRRQHSTYTSSCNTAFQSLKHQRLGDCGLLERTLEIMEKMAKDNSDVVAQKISHILRPLLAVEDNSFKGGCYQIDASSEAGKQESQCIGDTSKNSHAIHIHIPYFGTVQIEHQSAESDQTPSAFDASGQLEAFLLVPGLAADVDEWALQGVDMALFSNLANGSLD